MWPGLVGKGPDSEPPIGLDEMLDLTAAESKIRFVAPADRFKDRPAIEIEEPGS
jgi:hypothetical protein